MQPNLNKCDPVNLCIAYIVMSQTLFESWQISQVYIIQPLCSKCHLIKLEVMFFITDIID